jgi:hypothetical protein
MEYAKQANGSGHELSIGHSPSSARKKAVRKKAESPRPLRKEAGSKSKSGKLACRYCGSNDLAPSFIKRRDRRCRKCFSKRYGRRPGEEGEGKEVVSRRGIGDRTRKDSVSSSFNRNVRRQRRIDSFQAVVAQFGRMSLFYGPRQFPGRSRRHCSLDVRCENVYYGQGVPSAPLR